MNTKANLKNAREALGAKKYAEAVKFCNRVLDFESQNYNAYVFLGVAHNGLEQYEDAENDYKKAIEINQDQLLAWQGLVNLFEKREKWSDLAETLNKLNEIYAASNDGNRLLDNISKLCDIYRSKESDESKMPDLCPIWLEILKIKTGQEQKQIDRETQARRMRMNAGTPAKIRAQVEAEVAAKSDLGAIFETVLKEAETSDKVDADLQDLKAQYFNFLKKRIRSEKKKDEAYQKLHALAEQLCDSNVNAPEPYEFLIESSNVENYDLYDKNLCDKFASKFPEYGLSKLIEGYKVYEAGDGDEAFDLLSDGMEMSPDSLFGHQCLSWLYYNSGEFESGLEYATRGRDIALENAKFYGTTLDRVLLSMELCMATCYRRLNRKYYDDSMALCKKILSSFKDNIAALECYGLILSELDRPDEALEQFSAILKLKPTQSSAKVEIGWIYCKQGKYEEALQLIQDAIETTEEEIPEYYYRQGRVYWEMGDQYKSDKEYAFKYFIKAAKIDPHFSPAFTHLGHYYRVVEENITKAIKCYQKALVLDPSAVDAAYYLTDYYQETGNLDEAETILTDVTSLLGRTGWAWRRLGFLQLKRGEYLNAIPSFQNALRSDARDVPCWEGLAESYLKEGRYIAASKAFARARQLAPNNIYTSYQSALVKQKIGSFGEAIDEYLQTLALAEDQNESPYIPALKGLADTYLLQGRDNFQQGFYGRAAECYNSVINACLVAIEHSSFECFWETVGRALCQYQTVLSYAHIFAYAEIHKLMALLTPSPNELLKLPSDSCADLVADFTNLDVTEDFSLPRKECADVLLSCASLAYKQAIYLASQKGSHGKHYWHNLALIYYWYWQNNRSESSNDDQFKMALRCMKLAMKYDDDTPAFWNTLGVIVLEHDAKISQHAFIRAMELDPRSAVAWSNYGYLCLIQADFELANQAFETAQAIDPEFSATIIGQAYVAQLWNNSPESLFEHAYDLSNGSSLKANYGYASTVFSQVSSEPHAPNPALLVPPAFALQKLTEKNPDNPAALNLYGLLLERLEQYEQAAEAFAGAVLASEERMERDSAQTETCQKHITMIHANLARTLCASGDFQGAISSYNIAIESLTDNTTKLYCELGAGISYYFNNQLDEALSMFEQALSNAEGQTVELRQNLSVLLSQVLWALGGEEQRELAQQELFKSIGENANHLPSILGLCAMGLIQDNDALTDAAIQEMLKLPIGQEGFEDHNGLAAWLLSKYYEIKGSTDDAVRALANFVHQTPNNASLWIAMASQMMGKRHFKAPYLTATIAVSTTGLSMLASSSTASAQDKSLAYYNYAQSLLKQQEDSKTRKRKAKDGPPPDHRHDIMAAAQRAVMIAPWDTKSWALLGIAKSSMKVIES
ncbi:Superkiller protein 3 [Umbelopsis sp. WA50703]